MKVTLEAYKVEHGVEALGPVAASCMDILKRYATAGPAFTGRLEDGRLLGCAGLMVQVPWVADGWMIPTDLVRKYPIAFHKVVREAFCQLVSSLQLARVQVAVDASMPSRCAWIERMGFTREGLMRKFGPHGEAMYLYALIPGD